MNEEYGLSSAVGYYTYFLSNDSRVMNGEFRIVISRNLLKMSLLGRQ